MEPLPPTPKPTYRTLWRQPLALAAVLAVLALGFYLIMPAGLLSKPAPTETVAALTELPAPVVPPIPANQAEEPEKPQAEPPAVQPTPPTKEAEKVPVVAPVGSSTAQHITLRDFLRQREENKVAVETKYRSETFVLKGQVVGTTSKEVMVSDYEGTGTWLWCVHGPLDQLVKIRKEQRLALEVHLERLQDIGPVSRDYDYLHVRLSKTLPVKPFVTYPQIAGEWKVKGGSGDGVMYEIKETDEGWRSTATTPQGRSNEMNLSLDAYAGHIYFGMSRDKINQEMLAGRPITTALGGYNIRVDGSRMNLRPMRREDALAFGPGLVGGAKYEMTLERQGVQVEAKQDEDISKPPPPKIAKLTFEELASGIQTAELAIQQAGQNQFAREKAIADKQEYHKKLVGKLIEGFGEINSVGRESGSPYIDIAAVNFFSVRCVLDGSMSEASLRDLRGGQRIYITGTWAGQARTGRYQLTQCRFKR
jgi:hypothetical protein